jgi:hypothetical protein
VQEVPQGTIARRLETYLKGKKGDSMISGWIGVDLDGTLAEYHGWVDGEIGKPVPAMLERVKKWLAQGQTVKIFTARVCTGDVEQTKKIQDWCEFYLGQRLDVTATKDFAMIELWDDRCVQVVPNMGISIEEHVSSSSRNPLRR